MHVLGFRPTRRGILLPPAPQTGKVIPRAVDARTRPVPGYSGTPRPGRQQPGLRTRWCSECSVSGASMH
eukprot:840623-Rhodomonas_salina.2